MDHFLCDQTPQEHAPAAARGRLHRRYGWLQNLRPANPAQPAPPPPGANTPVTAVPNNPGFVHAPSLDQAATVAVLRSGHLSHAASGKQDLLAIDLSSERARLARWLLDGVKAGQPLGALLGYRFERGLHENHPGLILDRFIKPLRDVAPLTATRVDASGQAVESVPAAHVVDGLKLFRMWKAQPTFLKDTLRLTPGPTTAEFAALDAELSVLGQTADAVSDALVAESVHQVVRGNPVRAAATLEAIERGEAPPPSWKSCVRRAPGRLSLTGSRCCALQMRARRNGRAAPTRRAPPPNRRSMDGSRSFSEIRAMCAVVSSVWTQ